MADLHILISLKCVILEKLHFAFMFSYNGVSWILHINFLAVALRFYITLLKKIFLGTWEIKYVSIVNEIIFQLLCFENMEIKTGHTERNNVMHE